MKKNILILITFFIAIEIVSLIINLSFYSNSSQDLSLTSFSNLKTKEGKTIESVYKPHPFFGFVYDKERETKKWKFQNGAFINNHGFVSLENFECKEDERLKVAIFGGSTAFFMANVEFSTNIIKSTLNKLYPQKDIIIHNMSLTGGKQPQQLNIFNYFLKCFDISINFDGWNELNHVQHNRILNQVPFNFPDQYEYIFQSKLDLNPNIDQLKFLKQSYVNNLNSLSNINLQTYKLFLNIQNKRIQNQFNQLLKKEFIPKKNFDYQDKGLISKKIKNWSENLTKQANMAKASNKLSLFFMQPTLLYHQNHQGKEIEIFKNVYKCDECKTQKSSDAQFYQEIQHLSKNKINIIDGNAYLKNAKKEVFIDAMHMTEYGYIYYLNIIANELKMKLKDRTIK